METKEIEERALGVLNEANAIVVASDEDNEAAVAFVQGLKAVRREIKATFDPVVAAAHKAHKAATAARKKHLKPVDDAEAIVKRLIGTYTAERVRIAAEAQRKADEAARERARIAAEREAKELEERRERERAAKAERERRSAAESSPFPDPAYCPPPPPPAMPAPTMTLPPAPVEVVAAPVFNKPSAVSVREVWDGEVYDVLALAKAVAAGEAPVELLQANATEVRRYAQAMKGTCDVPGIRWSKRTSTTVR